MQSTVTERPLEKDNITTDLNPIIKTKENFCAACMSVPIAMGASLIGGKGTSSKNYRTIKNITFAMSLIITFVVLGIGIYMFFIKECSACKAS
jgi:hypothetical protein